MVIDMHVHTTNHKLWGLHTESATVDDIESLAKKYGVTKVVLLATYFPLKKSGLTNRELLRRIENRPLFVVFGSLDVENDLRQGIDELTVLARERKIAGIKLYPGYQNFSPSDRRIFPVYELAEELNLPVMIHTGDLHECCQKEKRDAGEFRCGFGYCPLFSEREQLAHPLAAVLAVSSFPKVKFILSHLANDRFEDLRNIMREHPNVFTDISGQFNSGSDRDTEQLRQATVLEIKKFLTLPRGNDRVMFATDFPIQSYEDTFDLVGRLGLIGENLEKFLYKNAELVLNQNEEVAR